MPGRVSHTLFFLIASAICFIIVLLILTGVVSGPAGAWDAGGLLALVLSMISIP